jgi:iron complex outermembrane receptor protein
MISRFARKFAGLPEGARGSYTPGAWLPMGRDAGASGVETMGSLRAALVLGLSSSLAISAVAQSQSPPSGLEELIVTATRVATNLQQTPMSIEAFTGERLELAGIDAGRDLRTMVPNAVFSADVGGERNSAMIVRGMPGVTTYIDGVWFGTWAFQQRNFVELERVEVLRGPQGTHFGRNTNGGAVQIITRKPADEFGARLDVELGELDHHLVKLAVDVPISERSKTKWIAASSSVDGFVDSLTAPIALGAERESLLRGDVLWQPSDKFSLRVNLTEQKDRGSDARILRISNTSNPVYIVYNVLAGNPDFLAQARAIDPSFPAPPFALAGDRFTPETHEAGYPGGSLGRWQTRSNVPGPTSIADPQSVALTLDWHMTDHWSLESLTSYVDEASMQVTDWDGSEFTQALHMVRNDFRSTTEEVHALGTHLNGRLRSLLGLYYLHNDAWARESGWWFWEFAVPNTGPNPGSFGPPGVGGRPALNLAALGYVRAWGATVGNAVVANFFPPTFWTSDRLFNFEDVDRAVFGELTIDLAKRLSLTLGVRITEDEQWGSREYRPVDSFRPAEPGVVPGGDPFAAGALLTETPSIRLGTISTPRASLSYQATDTLYLYTSYAEGFTSGEVDPNPYGPDPIVLGPEVVKTTEIGIRSDWLQRRLRFNATAFDSHWDGMRVLKTIPDPNNPGLFLPLAIRTDDGVARASGLEVDLDYVPSERWELNFALGMLDTKYLEIGDPAPNGTGLQPGTPFAFAPKSSYSIAVSRHLPLARGGDLLVRGDYGWMNDYVLGAYAAEYQRKNPDGSVRPEPAYGLLNARVVYTPPGAKWRLSVFGTNLTNEWYVNGGFDLGFAWGYGPVTIGRPREVGVGMHFTLH